MEGSTDKDFILNGFSCGFSLGIRRDYRLTYGKVRPRPSPLPLLTKLNDEVSKGRIIGPFCAEPIKDLFVSPLYVIPKPNSDKHRMIFNLSHPDGGSVNDNIPENLRSVQYCSVQDVGQCLLTKYGNSNGWLAKVDLADAYRIVPIRQEDWKFLGIFIEDEYYVDRMLPMGASSSCQIFNRISNSIRWIFSHHCPTPADMFNYLDDFLIISDSAEHCEAALAWFEKMCAYVGIPIAPHKTVRPTTSLVFLGIGIDSVNLAMFIPTEKRHKMRNKLQQFLLTKSPQVKKWQSLAGSLNHVSQVVVSGRIYLSSVYASLSGILSQSGNKRRNVNSEVKEDLKVWYSLLESPPTRQFKVFDSISSTHPDIYTDASTSVGYGCMYGTKWFAGLWAPGKKCNITVLELYPIFIALSMLQPEIRDTAINIYTDNHALVSVLNKLYCKDQALRKIMRPLAMLSLGRNIHIVARHVRGELNVGPDLLSRGMVSEFRQRFPHMDESPVRIPDHLLPENSDMIQWK